MGYRDLAAVRAGLKRSGAKALCAHWTDLAIHVTNVDRLASCYARWWNSSGSGEHGRWALLGDARITPRLVVALRCAGTLLERSPGGRRKFPEAILARVNPLERWLGVLQFRGEATAERQPLFGGSGPGDSQVIWDVGDRSALLCLELALMDPTSGGCDPAGQGQLIEFDPSTGKFAPVGRAATE